MKSKKVLALLLSGLLCLSLAACGGTGEKDEATTAANDITAADESKADTNEETETPSGEQLTLTVLTHRTDRHENGALDEMTDAFEAANNCKVVYQSYTSYADDVSTMMSTKEYGDVLMVPDTIKLSDLSNFLEPLGTYDELKDKYNWADQKMFNGTVYGLAHMGSVAGGITYNKRIWSEAGVTELPKTPEAFIAGLEAIRDNVADCIPYYTNYSSPWTIVQWASLVVSASGDPAYENNILIEGKPLFEEGGAYYNVYKLLFDTFKDASLHEPDPMTADWEASKAAINNGQIATMVMGSWAVSQFKESGPNPDDISYMPAPFSVNGKQYAQSSSDYAMGVNVNRSDEIKELGKKYITWFIEESGFAQTEGGVPTLKGAQMPDYLEAFADVELFTADTAPEGLVGTWDEINKESEVNTWGDESTNFKMQIAEIAFAGGSFDDVLTVYEAMNTKWLEARANDATVAAYTA